MRLNIYHTNDIHADFSFLSRVRAYLSDHREKSDLYFDSGDFLDLKSVLVQADRGRSALELLALCRPEAMAVGNNEIDLGSADLERLAQLPMLCANICRNDGTPVPGLKSHVILERCGKRFLVIGLAPYYGAGMIADKYNLFFEMGNLRTIDPVPAVTQILNKNRGKYDFSILLSHSGHLVDRELAKRLPPMDLWLGGHSHTVVAEAGYSQSGKGEYLGRVALDIDEGNIRILDSAQIELPARRSPSFDTRLKEAQATADAILSQELPILRELDFDPFRESALTNFICDCLHRKFGGDLALMHSGIALGPLRRPVSRKSLIELLPSKLNPTVYTLPGEKLLKAIRRSLDDAYIRQSGQGSGFRGTVLGCLGFSSNVTLRRDPFAVEIDGKPLDPRKDYTIVTDDYLQRGSGYPSLAVPEGEAKFDKRFIRDLVEEYLMNEAVFRAGEVKRER